MIKGTGRSPYTKRSRSRAFPVVVVLALVAVAGLFYLRVIDGCEEPSEVPLVSEAGEPRAADAEPDESQPAREDEEAAAPPLAPETIPLPSLEESDPLIRELAGEASARSEFRAWLAAPELVRRFVGLFHIRGIIQGEVGLDDPADTAWLGMLCQLAAARVPGLILALRIDYTGEVLQISGNLRTWLWPAQVVLVAIGQLFRRDVRQLLRATS